MGSVRLKTFPRTFWAANLMELFERAAYYGLNSVLAVYLKAQVDQGGLGFDVEAVGFLQSIIYAATYVIPILGGALADLYGYRRMLMVAFAFLSTGYLLAGYATAYAWVFLCLLVMASGAGLFKPIISGTIARTTNQENSAFGFGLYYWAINLGATAAPLVVTWLRGAFSFRAVFIASACYTAFLYIPALCLYREPPAAGPPRRLGESLRGAAEVLADSRFMLMVVVYSGFWVLYFQQFGTILFYLTDFVDRVPVDRFIDWGLGWFHVAPGSVRFAEEHVTVINGLTIILLQIVISWLVKERRALPVMVSGMALGAVGFLLLALSPNGWVFVAGMVVFSIGEMTAHPKYYSLVGSVAPPDRKAVYMGYAFLYGVFGALLGSNLGAVLYQRMLLPWKGKPEAAGQAARLWSLFALLDLVSAAGLWLFMKKFGPDTPESRRGARRVMIFVYTLIWFLGLGFLFFGLGWFGQPPAVKTIVQASIFLLLGTGGVFLTLRGSNRV